MARLPTKSFLAMAAMVAMLPMAASAQTPIVTQAPPGQWPKTLEPTPPAAAGQPPAGPTQPGQSPGAPAPAPEPQWSPDQIQAAKARCTAALAAYQAEATQLDPIDEGECGAPAPVLLTSIGSAPRVVLSQPATVTCDMVEALGEWLKSDVQPAARSMLGARVVRIEVLSSYSCRYAYGRKKTRMSEHGRANALDIKSFQMDRSQPVDVLADWGLTERDIQAQIAAAEAAAKAQALAQAKKAEAEAAARAASARGVGVAGAPPQPQPGPHGGTAVNDPAAGLKGLVGSTIGRAVRGPGSDAPTGLSLEQPTRLGGPKDQAKSQAKKSQGGGAMPPAAATAPPAAAQRADVSAPGDRILNPKQAFLRHLQATGCKRFMTALGPEANNAHRNHFHFDMAQRSSGAYCR